MSVEPSPLEQLLRHDRQIVLGVLVSVTVIAWIYTLSGAGMAMNAFETTSMSGADVSLDGMGGPTSSSGYIFVLLVMWWMMMVAMMLPSAIPVILLTAALNRRSTSDQPPYGAAAYFTIGYLLAWFIFSVVAVAGHWVMESKGLLSPIMHSTNNYLSVGLLLAAGVWQFSPIKQACLRHCRSPVEFITHHRRRGNRGALLMGLHHGTYCLGCCWFLMLLLFVGGVMNFYWIAGLALFVVIEKLVSRGAWFSRITGAGLVIAGVALLVL